MTSETIQTPKGKGSGFLSDVGISERGKYVPQDNKAEERSITMVQDSG